MLLEYGHAEIKWGGESYRLTPSFSNIAKLGKPKEIVDTFHTFISIGTSDLTKFGIALDVVNACCDKELPTKLTGEVVFSERKGKFLYKMPNHNLPMFHDIIMLAHHCLLHGICGNVESESDDKGDPITEFDAYRFIEMAIEHLHASREEAASMTMTEFVRRINVKYPQEKAKKDENKRLKNEFDELVKWREEQDAKGLH